MRWQLFAILTVACSGHDGASRGTTTTALAPSAQASAERRFAPTEATTQTTCPDAALRIDGVALCPAEASARGLTIIDLNDAWTPALFAKQADGSAPTFRTQYLALAAGHDAKGKPLEDVDQLAELYGVLPSLAIVRERIADDARHACHKAINSAPIALLDKPYAQDHKDFVKLADQTRVFLAMQLERERVKLGLPDIASLAKFPELADKVARWKHVSEQHDGIVAAQQHLVCEKFLAAKDADGSMTWKTSNAVELFQRRNFLMPNERLDPETREALAIDSRELDFRLALRILRERVVDATGLIEDGTAGSGPACRCSAACSIPRRCARRAATSARSPTAPPISSAPRPRPPRTQLGWTEPRGRARVPRLTTPAACASRSRCRRCPPTTRPHMELSAEIDRGDVWYDETPIAAAHPAPPDADRSTSTITARAAR